ncbi:MAG TPA: hypothetical protein VK181_02655 [Rhizobium sp.]|nr:hypothetical protein [Rhizobium sp.]
MARDDFPRPVIDRLSRRAGMKCSCPDCRIPTAGPDGDGGVTNTGVAAHISAASPGGPRYDADMTSQARCDISNGIWLCQNHAKLIDDDEFTCTPTVLRDWKDTAEHMAALEAKGFAIRRASPFPYIEDKAPKLVAEMREDLRGQPLVRQFILLSRKVIYNGSDIPYFVYYHEDHEYLLSLMTIMEHGRAVYDVAFNRVPRYHFTEEFVSYLIGSNT